MIRTGRRTRAGAIRVGAGAGAGGMAVGVVQVLGVPETIAKFQAIGYRAQQRLQGITTRSARSVISRAKQIVPVQSGQLRRGIEGTRTSPFTWFISASSIEGGADKEYASYVEFGTSKMSPRPFLRPAMNEQVPETTAMLKALGVELQAM